MKNVILGAGGQLGRALCHALPGELFPLAHTAGDLTDPARLRQTLTAIRPSVVINAAGFTQVDRAEGEPREAFNVNAVGVRDLAMICRDLDAVLIHFSTNYVFGLDAWRVAAYGEDDVPGPVNVYGTSKLAGEAFVRQICPRHFILRTCGLYGASQAGSGRRNFVDVMLQQAAAGERVRVVADQLCTPTSATDLAQAMVELLESQAFGLYHVTNAGACTWHECATAIFEIARIATPLTPIRSEEYVAPAQRPKFSVLSNYRWLNAGFTALRPWREALAEYLRRGAGVSPAPFVH